MTRAGLPRTATAIAVEDTELLPLTRANFNLLLNMYQNLRYDCPQQGRRR
jgi:CRP-like cAMP-binding protein